MSNEDLDQARAELASAGRNGIAYRHEHAAAAASWAVVAVADALSNYLKAKTPDFQNPPRGTTDELFR